MEVLVARSCRLAGRRVPTTAVLLCVLSSAALAQQMPLARIASSERAEAPARMEVSASSLPLFGSSDGATRSTRLDMLWLPPRQPSLGLALGLTSTDGSAFIAPGNGSAPAVDLGLHWRYDSVYRIDVSAWMRMASPPPEAASLLQDAQPNYGARFEMRINSAPHTLFADRGLLGLQLDGGARIGVRRYAGHPMIYYRTSF